MTAPRTLNRAADEFAEAVLDGLGLPQKRLEAKHFYDEQGSRLFDRICKLDAYYPTRVETELLRERAAELSALIGEGTALVELGSGSSTKTRLLLDRLDAISAYVPVDISAEHLRAAAARLAADYPNLAVTPVVADFTGPLSLPGALADVPKLLFFPGSTIGNFTSQEAHDLLQRLNSLPKLVALVVGVDLRKDVGRLIRAYDDEDGVTAAFNKNLLVRINRELDGTFDPDAFAHDARWNEAHSRIEMHLVSREPQAVTVAGRRFQFARGETIHTENSHKYSPRGFQSLAGDAGWRPLDVWVDADRLFSIHVLAPKPRHDGP